jgi:hypothetical protein
VWKKRATLEGYERIKSLAKAYHHFVDLEHDSAFDFESANSLVELMGASRQPCISMLCSIFMLNESAVADFEPDFNEYLRGVQDAQVSSAKELAEWNRAHADIVLPSGITHRSSWKPADTYADIS